MWKRVDNLFLLSSHHSLSRIFFNTHTSNIHICIYSTNAILHNWMKKVLSIRIVRHCFPSFVFERKHKFKSPHLPGSQKNQFRLYNCWSPLLDDGKYIYIERRYIMWNCIDKYRTKIEIAKIISSIKRGGDGPGHRKKNKQKLIWWFHLKAAES